MSLKIILLESGWKNLASENAGFVPRDEKISRIIAIMALHVGDTLVAMEDAEVILNRKSSGDLGVSAWKRRWSFVGDTTIKIEVFSWDRLRWLHCIYMSAYRVSPGKMKAPAVVLDPHQLCAFHDLPSNYSGVPELLDMMRAPALASWQADCRNQTEKNLAEANKLIKQIVVNHLESKIFFCWNGRYDPADVTVLAVRIMACAVGSGLESPISWWTWIETWCSVSAVVYRTYSTSCSIYIVCWSIFMLRGDR